MNSFILKKITYSDFKIKTPACKRNKSCFFSKKWFSFLLIIFYLFIFFSSLSILQNVPTVYTAMVCACSLFPMDYRYLFLNFFCRHSFVLLLLLHRSPERACLWQLITSGLPLVSRIITRCEVRGGWKNSARQQFWTPSFHCLYRQLLRADGSSGGRCIIFPFQFVFHKYH